MKSAKALLATNDASVWAEEFILRIDAGCDPTDFGWVVGWFANAMAAEQFATAVAPSSVAIANEADEARAAGDPMRVWDCRVGWAGEELPDGSDGPMRRAVASAFEALTGHDVDFIFSGWNGRLSEPQMAVVLDTIPSADYEAEWMRRRDAEAGTPWETVEFRRRMP